MDGVDELIEFLGQSTVTADNEFNNSTVGGDGIGTVAGGTSAEQAAVGNAAEDDAQHPRFRRDYKNEGKAAELQRQRRQEHLERQTLAREDWLKRRREIEGDDSAVYRRQISQVKRNPYKNMLMFSDWLIDIPGTLSTEWTMLPSPVGRRTLVVARKGETRVYFKNGGLAANFPSFLPGANAKTKGSLTVLDAILDAPKRRLYLLDLLWWNKLMYTDMEFTARRFFLQSRIEEMNSKENFYKIGEQEDDVNMEAAADTSHNKLTTKQKHISRDHKKYKFVLLPSCICSPDEIGQFMRTVFPFRLDGLLFYYNSAFYIPEQTPLVGWLKPWMLPEVLGVSVPKLYMEEEVHGCSQDYIQKFNRERGHISSAEKAEMQQRQQAAAAAEAAMEEAMNNAWGGEDGNGAAAWAADDEQK